jgi:hypothetical protein
MTNTETSPALPRTSPPSSNRTCPIKAYGSPSTVTEKRSASLGFPAMHQPPYVNLSRRSNSPCRSRGSSAVHPGFDAPAQASALPSSRVWHGTASGTMADSDFPSEHNFISGFALIDFASSLQRPQRDLSSFTTSLSLHAVSLYADQLNEAFPLRTSSTWTSPFLHRVVADSPGLSSDGWPGINHGACSEFTARYGLHLRLGSRTGFAGPFVTSLSTSLCSNAEKSDYRGERVLSPGEYVSTR